MGLGDIFGIATQAISVNQNALNVVSNNISNINTQGYSKRRIELSSIQGMAVIGTTTGRSNYVGAGVEVNKIISYRDTYLDSRFQSENSKLNYFENLFNNAQEIANILDEFNDNGLRNAFTKFYNACQNLKDDPSNLTYRKAYATEAQSVANMFNSLSKELKTNRKSLVGDIKEPGSLLDSKANISVNSINADLENLAQLNYKIIIAEAKGNGAADLVDQRSQLIDKISSEIPVSVTENSNGTVNLYLDGLRMVMGDTVQAKLEAVTGNDDTPCKINVVDLEGNLRFEDINSKIKSGNLGAILEMGSSEPDVLTYSNVIEQIDTLAKEFANVINGIQTFNDGNNASMAMEFDATTNEYKLIEASENIFISNDGSAITAGNIKINENILNDPYLIGAAYVDLSNYDPRSVGNGDNITKIIENRNEANTNLGNSSLNSYFSSIVSNTGLKIDQIKSKYETQYSNTNLIELERQNTIGVNLDEELMDLVKYQRAYEAASRIFNTGAELLMTLVNLGK